MSSRMNSNVALSRQWLQPGSSNTCENEFIHSTTGPELSVKSTVDEAKSNQTTSPDLTTVLTVRWNPESTHWYNISGFDSDKVELSRELMKASKLIVPAR